MSQRLAFWVDSHDRVKYEFLRTSVEQTNVRTSPIALTLNAGPYFCTSPAHIASPRASMRALPINGIQSGMKGARGVPLMRLSGRYCEARLSSMKSKARRGTRMVRGMERSMVVISSVCARIGDMIVA